MTLTSETTLLLLVLLPIFVIFFTWRGIARRQALRRIGDAELVQTLMSQVSYTRRFWKATLWLIALAMLIIALARPTWGIEADIIETEGAQIVIVLDVSMSMAAEDLAPNRLERAKLDLRNLFETLAGNDFGIVLFAADALNYMPMTYDAGAAEVFLRNISVYAVTNQGTAMAKAIGRGIATFDNRTDAQKIMILMTDGEDHEGDTLAAARRAAENGITIHTIGYGTPQGSIIPLYNAAGDLIDYKTRDDILVETFLDEELLQNIAEETGGFYAYGDLIPIIEAIAQAQSGDLGEQIITRRVERFTIFVALAFFALSLEILIPETRRKESGL